MLSEEMKEKITDLWWFAVRDYRDYKIKEERLRIFGAVYSHTPTKYDINPLLSEEYEIQQWKLVFSILLDTHNVRFVQIGGDFNLYELWADDKKLLETHFPPYSVEKEA